MFDKLKSTKQKHLKFGTRNSLYFLVKWVGKDYNFSTWEDQFFLKCDYSKVLSFGSRKCQEYYIQKQEVYSKTALENFRKEDIIGSNWLRKTRNSAPFSGEQQKNIKELVSRFSANKYTVLRGDCKIQVIGLFAHFKYSCSNSLPTMVICAKSEIENWRKTIQLFLPRLNFLEYSIFNEAEDFVSRYEFYSSNVLSMKFEVLFVSYESFDFYAKYLIPLTWRTIIIETEEKNPQFPTILKDLQPINTKYTPFRLLMFSDSMQEEEEQSDPKQMLIRVVHNKINTVRFINPTLLSASTQIKCFEGFTVEMVEFYVNNASHFNKKMGELELNKLQEFKDNLIKLEGSFRLDFEQANVKNFPLTFVSQLAVLQMSNFQKRRYKEEIYQNMDTLLKSDMPRIRKKTQGKMIGLVKRLLKICNFPAADLFLPKEEIIRKDCKLRWLLKYLKVFVFFGKSLILLFRDDLHLSFYKTVLRQEHQLVCFEIGTNNNSKEISHTVLMFNKVKNKLAVLLTTSKCISKIEGVQSDQILVFGGYQDIREDNVWSLVCLPHIKTVSVTVVVSEGVEEKVAKSQAGLWSIPPSLLNQFIKYKVNFVNNIRDDPNLEQNDRLFRRLIDGSLLWNPKDHAVSSEQGQEFKGVLKTVKYKAFSVFFNNLKEDVNPLFLWSELVDQHTGGNRESNKPEETLFRKRMMKLESISDLEGEGDSLDQDLSLDTYLRKRFISTRIKNKLLAPRPEKIFAMGFEMRLHFTNFVTKYGIHFESIKKFYRKFLANFPESPEDNSGSYFANFKEYVREFIYAMGLRNTKAFSNNIMFGGFKTEDLYVRVLALSLISKLVKKYRNKPELFFNEEFVELPSDHIPIKDNRTYDYSSGNWNNFDDYCLLMGINKHGFGEWKMILMDEKVWQNQLKGFSGQGLGNPIHHLLLKKLNSSDYQEYKETPHLKGIVVELVKRRGYNLLNLVFEFSTKIRVNN